MEAEASDASLKPRTDLQVRFVPKRVTITPATRLAFALLGTSVWGGLAALGAWLTFLSLPVGARPGGPLSLFLGLLTLFFAVQVVATLTKTATLRQLRFDARELYVDSGLGALQGRVPIPRNMIRNIFATRSTLPYPSYSILLCDLGGEHRVIFDNLLHQQSAHWLVRQLRTTLGVGDGSEDLDYSE